jgi:hypothetical protein
MQIDLHGYHPRDIDLENLLKQAWEMGATEVELIHGHGRKRGISVGWLNTKTGHFGLCIRAAIRGNSSLKPWVKISTLDCRHGGSTKVKLKSNPNPTRSAIEMPTSSVGSDPGNPDAPPPRNPRGLVHWKRKSKRYRHRRRRRRTAGAQGASAQVAGGKPT